MTCEVCALYYNFATIYPLVHNKVTVFTISTRHILVKHGCPDSNIVKIWQTSPCPTFWHPWKWGGAWGVSEVRGSNRWTDIPSLFTVSSPKLSILHAVSGTELQTERQTDGQTDDPITRWPGGPFIALGFPIRRPRQFIICRLIKISLIELKMSFI